MVELLAGRGDPNKLGESAEKGRKAMVWFPKIESNWWFPNSSRCLIKENLMFKIWGFGLFSYDFFLCGGTFFQTWPRMTPSHGFCRGFSRWNVWDWFFCIFVVWSFREFLIWSKSMGIDLMVPPQWHLGTKKRGLIKELSTTNCPFLSGLNKAVFPGGWGGLGPLDGQ